MDEGALAVAAVGVGCGKSGEVESVGCGAVLFSSVIFSSVLSGGFLVGCLTPQGERQVGHSHATSGLS